MTTTTQVQEQFYQHLLNIHADWRNKAKRMFIDSDNEENPMGKRLIRHGAFCHFNHAETLKEALENYEQEMLKSLLRDRRLVRRLCFLLFRQFCSRAFHFLRLV